jgi:hypothetical protein
MPVKPLPDERRRERYRRKCVLAEYLVPDDEIVLYSRETGVLRCPTETCDTALVIEEGDPHEGVTGARCLCCGARMTRDFETVSWIDLVRDEAVI